MLCFITTLRTEYSMDKNNSLPNKVVQCSKYFGRAMPSAHECMKMIIRNKLKTFFHNLHMTFKI